MADEADELLEAADEAEEGGTPPEVPFRVPPSTVLSPELVRAVYYSGAVPLLTAAQIDTAETVAVAVISAVPADDTAWQQTNALSRNLQGLGMAISGCKVILQFSSPQDDNWGEIYNFTGSLSSVAGRWDAAGDLVRRRRSLLGPTNTFKRVRVVALDNTRLSTLIGVNLNGSPSAGVPYPVTTALEVRLQSTDHTARRFIMMRGLYTGDASVEPSGGPVVLSAGMARNLTAYYAALEDAGCFIPKLKPSSAGGIYKNRGCSGVSGVPRPGFATITTLAAHGFAAGADILLSRFPSKDLPTINGHYKAEDGTAGSIIVVNYQIPNDAAFPNAKGFVRAFEQNNVVIDKRECHVVTLRGRQTKNLVSLSRGARRALTRRSSP